jgi:PAS domain S-box-containing protein
MSQEPTPPSYEIPWSRLQRLLATVGPSVVVLIFAALVYTGFERQEASQGLIIRSHSVAESLESILTRLLDAETAQRGYLLTGNEAYLAPYKRAGSDVEAALAQLRSLARDVAAANSRLDSLSAIARARLAEIDTVLTIQQTVSPAAALARIETGRGRQIMEEARRLVSTMEEAGAALLEERQLREARYAARVRWTLLLGGLGTVLVALLTSTLLARHADALTRAARELDDRNTLLAEQAEELERHNQRLRDQTLELEAQQQQLQEQTVELEMRAEELQTINEELEATTESLRQGERRLELALSAGQLGTWEWEIDSGRVAWCENSERIHGLKPGTFPGTFEAYQGDIHPGDRQRVLQSIRAAVEQNVPHHLVYRIVRPDGEVRWLEAHGQVVANRSGRPAWLVGVCSDITERKRANDALRLIADSSDALASSLDYETTLATVAQLAVPALADWCVVDIVESNGTVGLKRLAVAHHDPTKAALARALADRYPPNPSARYGPYSVARTGSAEWMPEVSEEFVNVAISDAGHRRTLRELGLRSYMAVPLAARGTVLGVVTFVAAESGRRFSKSDLDLAEELARRAAMAIDNARLVKELAESRDQLEQQAMELEMTNEELHAATDELHAANDDLRGAIAEREAQRAVAEAARRHAEAASQAKSQFLAAMSHELRTPLNAIAGYVELMEMEIRGPVTPEQRVDLERIRRSGRHLLELVDDILNFAKLEAGKLEYTASDVQIAEVIAGIELLVAPQIAVRGLTYSSVKCSPDVVVHADAKKLEQILLNLLTNAIKFTDAGGRISVICDADDTQMRIYVTDTGRGLAPDALERIFEPFVQVDRHLTQASQQGVGLGLTISRDLARRMGGDLTVASTLGDGSTFTITLPRAAVGAPAGSR